MKNWAGLSAVAAVAIVVGGRAEALTVAEWRYDATLDATVTEPFVGSGRLTTTDAVGPGDYRLTDFRDVTIEIELGPWNFTLEDLVPPLEDVDVRLYDSPSGLSAFFV